MCYREDWCGWFEKVLVLINMYECVEFEKTRVCLGVLRENRSGLICVGVDVNKSAKIQRSERNRVWIGML